MSDKQDHPHTPQKAQSLRAEAEARLARAPVSKPAAQRGGALLHELRVHQIELEMQNEALRQTQVALEASRDRYVDLYEFAPIGYLTLTAEALIAEINLTGTKLLGSQRKQLIDRRFLHFVAEPDQARWHRFFLNVLGDVNGEMHRFDMNLQRDDQSIIHVHFDCQRWVEVGTPPVVRIALTDTTQLLQAQTELSIAAVAFESQEGIFITDASGVILKVNDAFTKITGYSAKEALGKTPRLLRSGRHDATFYAALWESLITTGTWHGEVYNRRKNGEIYPQALIITAVTMGDGEALFYVASLIDITQQKLASEQIKILAFYDPLTNLPNRRLLKDKLHMALASSARTKRHGALLFIDLDNFKELNDTLGHDIGDLLLKQVAQRLVGCLREIDSVARLGGDEFVVLLEDLSNNPDEAAINAHIAGQKILTALNAPYLLEKHNYRCTSSIGAVLFGDYLNAEDDLLKLADIAMYAAKSAGRNTVRFFDQAMQAVLTKHAILEADLRLALENHQFTLYYQLQTTHDNRIVGAEALIRWLHPKLGLILPTEFIPLTEETGLIIELGQWVLETACAQLKMWESDPHTRQIQLAVNISALQLHQAAFFEQIDALVEKYTIAPNRLKLELTESMVLDDIDENIVKMQAIKHIGVGFSMDDFGTGYSSLSYLTQLPLDQLKIDQSFVRNLNVKHTDALIVQTIIGMANNLGMEVIAEGVETETQRAFLEQNGCALCQGYLFSRPVPLAEFEQLLIRAWSSPDMINT
jgi:diguanylate cyclase (GGDEF)-like protein/PAS domain S-box-containing protein